MKPVNQRKKAPKSSLFKRIMAWLHLWLGLASGIIVVIVSITGCCYVFENEIKDMIETWRFVEPQQKAFLNPSQLTAFAEKRMKGEKATSVTYSEKDEAAIVAFFTPDKVKDGDMKMKGHDHAKMAAGNPKGKKGKDAKAEGGKRRMGTFTSIYVNPYSGEILNVKEARRGEGTDFFRFMLNGHRALWLPYDIGRPIIGVAILIFFFLLISGIVLWWPVKWIKSVRDKSFKVKWNAKFKRVNYDLHNVFGFYSMLFLLLISTTGLVWSFKWWSEGLYWLTSGGATMNERTAPLSDTTSLVPYAASSIDKVWLKLKKENPEAAGMMISIPATPSDAISASVYKTSHTYFNVDSYYYDQYSLKEMKSASPFAGKYAEATLPNKIRRMNYDIHVGAVLGLPGKIMAFLASLVSASLPITGFLIWWGKKKKKKKPDSKANITPGKKEIILKPASPAVETVVNF